MGLKPMQPRSSLMAIRLLLNPTHDSEIWCREATEGNLIFEFIYVPSRLKELMTGQRFFSWKSEMDPAPPSTEMADVCLYTNVPPSATLFAPNSWYRLLQTYVDTVLIGALALGGEVFVERTILSTGFWAPSFWDNDRDQGFYPRSPNDLYCAYDGLAFIDGGACPKLLLDYRFDWAACMVYQQGRALGETVCSVLAVTDAAGQPVNRSIWRQRVATFVDKKLGEAHLGWFVDTLATDQYGHPQQVYDARLSRDLADWTRTDKGSNSLLALRGTAGSWPRLCDQSGAPVWRGQNLSNTTACAHQGVCSLSWLAQRGWLQEATLGACTVQG